MQERASGDRSSDEMEPRSEGPFQGERIAKVLARAGTCSRRDAERMIADGRVSVDGKVLTTPAVNVTEDSVITVDGKPLRTAEATRVWRFHKPVGTITTARDPRGRRTVFDMLPSDLPRVVTVGRLDFNTEGLLLLTNDGELARHLELPQNAWTRCYRVRVRGAVDAEGLASVAGGVTIASMRYEPVRIEVEESDEAHELHWLTVEIHEGKNREVRNIMAHLGLHVLRLIRVRFGPFSLGKLQKGEVDEVPPSVLRRSLKEYFTEDGFRERRT